jgi:DNA-nicking Smr family endonuclease
MYDLRFTIFAPAENLSFGFIAEANVVAFVLMDDEPIQLPIDGVLDLHTFKPGEVKELVLDYLAACQERGIFQVRLIHGKGIGNLRRTVHALLQKHPEVISFTLDHPQFGGWGATIVHLRKPAA